MKDNFQKYNALVAQIRNVIKELDKVDVSKEPTDAERDAYEALLSSAHDLKTKTNYILYG